MKVLAPRRGLLWILCCGFASVALAVPPNLDGPLSSSEAPKSFQLEPGLRLELVAAEPLVVSPVACAFDERGRLFVAENRDYPTGPAAGEAPQGRIALLTDADGDGRYEKRAEFATGLTYPNGVLPWKDGVIVTCAPDILWLRDTDGDNVADQREVLFTGFSISGSTQLRVSHPLLSPDNWIYVTSGLTGGKITCPQHPDRPAISLQRTDFRFRPDLSEYEAASGGAQFGHTFDDFGRRFICYNRVQTQHVVIDAKTLARNPKLAFSEMVQNCPVETVAEPLKGHGAASRLYPLSSNVTTADSHAGTFTAACAVTVFRGSGLPELFAGSVFSCDPTGNLVHVDKLESRGVTFAARPQLPQRELLASSDSWFRPVFLTSGPDGALYVCDMYRKTIEHPDYLPVEIRKHTDFSGGKTMGRIWRVVRADASLENLARLRQSDLTKSTTAELVERLNHQDAWQRETAQRLLLARRDDNAVELLRRLITNRQTPAASVVLALHLLPPAAMDNDQLRSLLAHSAPPLREQAVLLVAGRIASQRAWLKELVPHAQDGDARVRFETAIALGNVVDPSAAEQTEIAQALALIAARDGDDRWLRAAVFSSLREREPLFLTALLATPRAGQTLSSDLCGELGRLVASSTPAGSWPLLAEQVLSPDVKLSFTEQASLLTGLGIHPATGALATKLEQLFNTAQELSSREATPLPARLAAIRLLGLAPYDLAGAPLDRLVSPTQPSEVQAAAIRALGQLRDERVATKLLVAERFAAFTPALREDVLGVLVASPVYLPGLFTALEQEAIPLSAIDALRRRQLTEQGSPELRARAQKLFGAVSGDRAKVYESLKHVVDLPSQAAQGHTVFKRACATCHRLDREGFAVGPDLFGIRNQPKAAILLHIVVPDQEITPGFAAYTAITTDGRTLTGLIAGESPTSITLRLPQGQEEQLLRSDIEQLVASKLSLMPQGLEKSITPQEFADLLAYLKGEK